jgi:hypothetical protein
MYNENLDNSEKLLELPYEKYDMVKARRFIGRSIANCIKGT